MSKQIEHIRITEHALEKDVIRQLRPSGSESSIDLEKSQPSSDTDSISAEITSRPVDFHNIPIHYRRPEVAAMIREAVDDTAPNERVLISGCGPAKLMDLMRATTADCITSGGPSIELHCEQFGW